MAITPDFLVTAFVVALIPGTGVVYTVSSGLFASRRASALAAVGCTLGILPHLAAAAVGLSAIVHTSARAFQVMKLAGVAYLLYLAWVTWRSTGGLAFEPTGAGRSGVAVVVRGIAVNLLNPKLTIFFLAYLPQFVDRGSPATPQLLLLGAVFMAVTLVVFVLYGALASGVRQVVLRSPRHLRALRRGFAAVFAGLGLRLAFEER